MKVVRCCVIVLASTVVFASCKPNGRILAQDAIPGSPSKADTVLPHKFHMNSGDTIKGESENVPLILRR